MNPKTKKCVQGTNRWKCQCDETPPGGKDGFLKSSGAARERAGKLIAELAELPHEARRNGFEMEYALEHYILGLPR